MCSASQNFFAEQQELRRRVPGGTEGSALSKRDFVRKAL